MGKVKIRGNKVVVQISINNKTYYINILQVNAIAFKYFQTKKSFEYLNDELQIKILGYIRNLCINTKKLTTQSIMDEIFLDFLPKAIKKEIISLDKCQE